MTIYKIRGEWTNMEAIEFAKDILKLFESVEV